MRAQTKSRNIAIFFVLTLGDETRCLLRRRLGELQARSGRVWKTSHPKGFDPRTFQPVASRYTDDLCINGNLYLWNYPNYLLTLSVE
jgi:hypothetical protein